MKSFRERNQVAVGIASIIVLALIFLLAFEFKKLPFISHNYTVTAEFADAAGLAPGSDVRIAGLKVGTVTKVKLDGDRVLVTLSVGGGVTIPRDATAAISLKTILGTKSVVIDAQGPGPYMKTGDRIPLDRTEIPFEIYQTANATVDLLTNVNGKELNEAFKALAAITADPHRNVAGTLKGAGKVLSALGSKSQSLDTVLSKGDEILASLDASAPNIQTIISQLNTVMGVLAQRRAVVQSLLRNTDELAGQLGGLLRAKRPDLDTVLNDLHSTLALVDANLGQVEEEFEIVAFGDAQRLLATDTTGFDAELLDIYLTEAAEVLATVAEHHRVLSHNPGDRDALVTVRRQFHTLKGSGRMVGLIELGELAYQVEQVGNRLIEEDRSVTPAVLALFDVAEKSFCGWVDELRQTRRVVLDARALHEAIDAAAQEWPTAAKPQAPVLRVAATSVEPGRVKPAAPPEFATTPPTLELIELPEFGTPADEAWPQTGSRPCIRWTGLRSSV